MVHTVVLLGLVAAVCGPFVSAGHKVLDKKSHKDRGRWQVGDVRLVGGRGQAEGTVLVYLNKRWGAVCDDTWDWNDAVVVCRQLGYPGLERPAIRSQHGLGSSKFISVVVVVNVAALVDVSFLTVCEIAFV